MPNLIRSPVSPALLWDTTAFLILDRVLLALLNVFGALVALEGTISHANRIFVDWSLYNDNRATINIMAVGSVVEFVACASRAVFAALGLMFSSRSLLMGANYYFVQVSVALGVVTIFVSTSLMLQWGAFGRLQSFHKQIFQILMLIFGVAHIILALACSYLQARQIKFLLPLLFMYLSGIHRQTSYPSTFLRSCSKAFLL